MIKRLYNAIVRERDLTRGSISKNIWVLALPLIMSNLIQTAFNLIDMFWVGRLGPAAIAAVAMSGTIIMLLMFFMIGISTGTMVLVARFIGAKNQSEADNTAMQSLTMGLALSIALSIIGYVITPWLLKILGASPEVMLLGTGYLRIIFMGIFIMFLSFLVGSILQGAGDTFTPMIIMALAAIFNIILDPLMIFGIGVFPALGVNGAAWATVIARILGSLIAIDVILRGRSRIHVRLKEYKLDFGIMWRIFKVGINSSAQMVLRGLMNIVMLSLVAAFSTIAVAAFGIAIRIEMLVLMPGLGFSYAAATLVGQNLGAGNVDRARKSAWWTTAYYTGFMAFMSVVLFVFAPQLVSIFNRNVQVVSIGVEYFRIVSPVYIFMALALVLNRSLVGAGDTFSALVITFVGLWAILIPLAYYLSKFTVWGLTGVWIAVVVALLVMAAMNVFWFELGRWKLKKV